MNSCKIGKRIRTPASSITLSSSYSRITLRGCGKIGFGDSKSLKQEAFTSLFAAWLGLDKSNYEVYQPSRTMQNQSEHAVEFCQIALSVEDCQHWSQRNDYRELLELTIVFCGK